MEKDFREKALEEAREDEESTKGRILRVAEELFASKGFKATTTRDISEAADVNIAMIHYHWGSKEELWNAIHYDLLERGFEFIKELFSEYPTARSHEEIQGFIALLLDYMADNPNIAKLGHSPGVEGAEKLWAKDIGELFFESFKNYIFENTDLDFGPSDPSLAVFCLLGAFTIFFYRPDLVELYFDEKPEELSAVFRRKASVALTTMIERFGQAE